jgi:hypothetical protein
MNNKGQIGLVVVALAVIIITGFLLSQFTPVIETFRLDLINSMDNHPETSSPLLKIIVYGFIPYMWIAYIFISVIALIVIVNQASRSPL